jgi:hypothetical protein
MRQYVHKVTEGFNMKNSYEAEEAGVGDYMHDEKASEESELQRDLRHTFLEGEDGAMHWVGSTRVTKGSYHTEKQVFVYRGAEDQFCVFYVTPFECSGSRLLVFGSEELIGEIKLTNDANEEES